MLWILLIPSALFAIFMLVVGLTYGFTLWDAKYPATTVIWIGTLIAPLLIVITLRMRNSSPAIIISALVSALALDAMWFALAFWR